MKNLKNIIASIILVAISFVSYTQYNTFEYKFYLTDNDTVDITFPVTNTVNSSLNFSLSEDTLNLPKFNSNMNFSMDSTIYKNQTPINSAYVTKIYLIYEGIDINNIAGNLSYIDPLIIESIDTLIHTLRNTPKTYTHVVFQIKYGNKTAYTGFAIDYVAEPTASIDTEVIEVINTRVYPNPVMNSLNIEFETINTDTEVEIYSTTGQLMYKDVEYRNFGINKVSVDMSNYPSGMYIVRLGNVVKKVIKQ